MGGESSVSGSRENDGRCRHGEAGTPDVRKCKAETREWPPVLVAKTMNDLIKKTILVTGGAGFLGKHVVHALWERGFRQIVVPRREKYDLTRESSVERLYGDVRTHVGIHLAAVAGGIVANRANPRQLVLDNIIIGEVMMVYAGGFGVVKIVRVG